MLTFFFTVYHVKIWTKSKSEGLDFYSVMTNDTGGGRTKYINHKYIAHLVGSKIGGMNQGVKTSFLSDVKAKQVL